MFLRAYERLGELRAPDRFGAWVTRITLSMVHRRHRLRNREVLTDAPEAIVDLPDPVDAHARFESESDATGLLEGALRTLPDTLRDAFLMRHMADAPYQVLAEALLIGPKTAERRVRRARERLLRYFRQRGLTDVARDVLTTSAVAGAALGEDSLGLFATPGVPPVVGTQLERLIKGLGD